MCVRSSCLNKYRALISLSAPYILQRVAFNGLALSVRVGGPIKSAWNKGERHKELPCLALQMAVIGRKRNSKGEDQTQIVAFGLYQAALKVLTKFSGACSCMDIGALRALHICQVLINVLKKLMRSGHRGMFQPQTRCQSLRRFPLPHIQTCAQIGPVSPASTNTVQPWIGTPAATRGYPAWQGAVRRVNVITA